MDTKGKARGTMSTTGIPWHVLSQWAERYPQKDGRAAIYLWATWDEGKNVLEVLRCDGYSDEEIRRMCKELAGLAKRYDGCKKLAQVVSVVAAKL